MRTPSRAAAVLVAAVFTLPGPSTAGPPAEQNAAPLQPSAAPKRVDAPSDLLPILAKAGEYVARYADTFRNVVVEESYRQWWQQDGHTTSRTLRSDLVFVAIPGSLPWTTFRDVYEVDGQKLRDREARLERLFAAPTQASLEAARAIVQESARHNVGTAYRDVNLPTLALQVLWPANQSRFSFERRGTRTIAGFQGVEVAFEERARPTLVRDPERRDVPTRGRAWIDATRGTVLRTEIEYDLEHRKSFLEPRLWERAAVATEYRLEPGLDVLVPDTMVEIYNLAHGALDCRARYSNYRRFAVSSDWKLADTPEEPGGPPQ